jgi:hypothetical protein
VIERTSGQTPQQLIALPFPYELSHVWEWFQRMCQMRQNTGFGVSRLSGEIVAWQQLEGIRLNPYELDVIQMLDSDLVAHHSKTKETVPAD